MPGAPRRQRVGCGLEAVVIDEQVIGAERPRAQVDAARGRRLEHVGVRDAADVRVRDHAVMAQPGLVRRERELVAAGDDRRVGRADLERRVGVGHVEDPRGLGRRERPEPIQVVAAARGGIELQLVAHGLELPTVAHLDPSQRAAVCPPRAAGDRGDADRDRVARHLPQCANRNLGLIGERPPRVPTLAGWEHRLVVDGHFHQVVRQVAA